MSLVDNKKKDQRAKLRDVQETVDGEWIGYSALFEQSSDAVFFIGLDLHHLAVNESASRMFGYTRDELLKLEMRDLVVPDEQPSTRHTLERMLNGEAMPIYVRMFRRKDKTTFPAEVNVALIRDSEGHPLHILSMLRDITERKRIEKQELELHAQREKVSILTQLGRITAHDLRTPLSVININLHLILRSGDAEFVRDRASKIEEQVQKLNSMIDDLQLISRLEAGMTPHWESISANNLITHTVEQLERMRASRKIQIDCILAPNMPEFESDMYYLSSSLFALVENAFLYTPMHGQVTIRTWYAAEQVHISVQDNGIGITPEEREHIFDPFFKGENASRVEGTGAGLGLSIVRRVIAMHGGSIEVDSQPGVGSIFTLHLPLHPIPHDTDPIL